MSVFDVMKGYFLDSEGEMFTEEFNNDQELYDFSKNHGLEVFKTEVVPTHWYEVEVTIGDETFLDAIKGKDKDHALDRAKWNWEAATHINVKGTVY